MEATISEQIAQWLANSGVTHNFSVTGGGAMFLNQALGRQPGIRTVYMHHEQACTMAAEGYARIAGKPAIATLTTGPGAINGLNGVFGAFTDSIPMLVLSGQVKRETCRDFHDLSDLRQLGDQEGPTIALARSVCKYARLIRTPEELETALPEAFSLAVSGRPGPVWLDIPLDIQGARQAIQFASPLEPNLPIPNALQLREVVVQLSQAQRPLILAGTGIRLSRAEGTLLAFAERTGIPVATAWTHDLIDSAHPLFAGRPGTIGTRAGNFCLQSADVVLVLGSRLNIRQTSYNLQSFAKKAHVIQVDIDAHELNKPLFKAHTRIQADAKLFLTALDCEPLIASLPDFSSWQLWIQRIRQQYESEPNHIQSETLAINPYHAIRILFDLLKPTDAIVCGNASACIIPFQIGNLRRGQRMFSNSGSASMGYDLPAALGASQVAERVICIAGDGSLQMNIQELQTLKTLESNVVVVVINNSGYLSISQTHENFFGTVIGANPASGVEFPDFAAVARAYGIPALTIKSPDDLPLLTDWLNRPGPSLIDLQVDPRQEFSPKLKSRVDSDGRFVSPELDDMFPFLPIETLRGIRQSAENLRSVPRGN